MNSIDEKLRNNWGLLSTFLREMDGYLFALQNVETELSIKEVRHVLHQMLGSARILSFESIVDDVIKMQSIVKGSGHPKDLEPLLINVKKELDSLFEYLLEERDSYQIVYWSENLDEIRLSEQSTKSPKIHLSTFSSIDDFQVELLDHSVSVAILDFEYLTPEIEELIDFSQSSSDIPLLLISNIKTTEVTDLVNRYSAIGGAFSPEISHDQLLDSIKVIANGRDLVYATLNISS